MEVPSRSSYFGIVDLAGFPKDRYYLYQSRWRPDFPMAHLLPHWTWPERIGQVTPVDVYTSGVEAELFLNGQSLGRKKKHALEYRLKWDDVVYAPGELKAVAYKDGKPWATDVEKTAGPAARLALQADRSQLTADGRDLSFVSVTITDADGIPAPARRGRSRCAPNPRACRRRASSCRVDKMAPVPRVSPQFGGAAFPLAYNARFLFYAPRLA